jgi:tRNA(adenine34) deaminase
MIPEFVQAGHRVVVPDLVGFGRSDKPKRESAHSFGFHRQILLELVERLDLHNVVLVVQGWGGALGLTLPMAMQHRFTGLLLIEAQIGCGDPSLPPDSLGTKPAERTAYAAPFPDKGYRAAPRAFAATNGPMAGGSAWTEQVCAFFQARWSGKTMIAAGMSDVMQGMPAMAQLRNMIRVSPEPICIDQVGHFAAQAGAALAQAATRYFGEPQLPVKQIS